MVMEILRSLKFYPRLAVLTALSLCAMQCTRKASIKLPESKPRLVVTCFISPGEQNITAVVRSSEPKFGSGSSFMPPSQSDITDATVLISDGQTEVKLLFDSLVMYYRIPAFSLPILPGKEYTLKVYTPDGKSVDAVTTVPSGVLQPKNFTASKGTGPFSSEHVNFSCVVDDVPGETTYLEFYTRTLALMNSNPGSPNPQPNDTIFSEFNFPLFETDEGSAREQYSFKGEMGFFNPGETRELWIDAALLNCNRDFFLYNKSAYESVSTGGDPFSNPTLVYTNIKNGFGCFGGYINMQFRRKVQ
jgi:hypothetical protein